MVDLKKLDANAALVAGHYQLMLDAMSGSLLRALDSANFDSTQARARLRFDVLSSENLFSNSTLSDYGVIATVSDQFMRDAIDDSGVGLDEPAVASLREHIAELSDNVRLGMRACVTRDRVAIERELRKVALQVELLQAAMGINKASALIRVKHSKSAGIKFTQVDAIGRKRKSVDFARSMARWHFLGVYVQSFLFATAKSGLDLAKVAYQDGREGFVFSITGGTEGYPTFADIQDVFHPNSTASVETI